MPYLLFAAFFLTDMSDVATFNDEKSFTTFYTENAEVEGENI